jgi:hypothetical protein
MAIEFLFTSAREPGLCDAYSPHAQLETQCIFHKGDFNKFCNECTEKTDSIAPVYESYLRSYSGDTADTVLLKYTKERWNDLIAKLKFVIEDIKKEDFDYTKVRGNLGQVIRALRFGIDSPDYEDVKNEEIKEDNEQVKDTENFDI